jgi:hypothetical protein
MAMVLRSLILAAGLFGRSLAQLDEVANFCAISGSSGAFVDSFPCHDMMH